MVATVLVVDDSEVARTSIRRALEYAGVDVRILEAADGAEALPLALSGGPDVWTVTMNPGPPLQDANVLEVSVGISGGPTTAHRTNDFSYLPPKARVKQITNASELITGPLLLRAESNSRSSVHRSEGRSCTVTYRFVRHRRHDRLDGRSQI